MISHDLLITNVHIYGASELRMDSWVAVTDGVISAVGKSGTEPHSHSIVSGQGMALSPGLIDVHCHGGGGGSVSPGDSIATKLGIQKTIDFHGVQGTTRLVISTVSMSHSDTLLALRDIRAAVNSHPGLIGAHLEGPFISTLRAGSQDSAVLRAPAGEDVAQILDAADGVGVQVTIAPEVPGALAAVREFVQAGWKVAIGHTVATSAQTLLAVEAGATGLTHAFNAMPPITAREAGPIGTALWDSRVFVELIADGEHLAPEAVHLVFSAISGRVMLISDAISMAGEPDGPSLLGGVPIEVTQSVARTQSGALAGSTKPVAWGVQNAIASCGISPIDALRAASHNPAKFLGKESIWGDIAPGFVADFVLWNKNFNVSRVWRDGIEILPAIRTT